MPRLVGELDAACAPLLDARQRPPARASGSSASTATCDVTPRRLAQPRAAPRRACSTVRAGPFGETLDTFTSRAFAVCDHQVAHVYVREPDDAPRVRELLAAQPGVARVFAGEERARDRARPPAVGRARRCCAEPDAWFAYPFWLDDRRAPDFARTVDIHRKPGYDPCELFFDPKLLWPQGPAPSAAAPEEARLPRRLFDVVPLDPSLVRGSHGLRGGPAGRAAADRRNPDDMKGFKEYVRKLLQ